MKPGPRNTRLQPLTPEEQEKQRVAKEEAQRQWEEQQKKFEKEQAEFRKKQAQVHDILEQLQIPHNANTNTVDGEELADILMDEDKVKAILTRIRNKAFW